MSEWSCFDLPWITCLWSTFHFFAGRDVICYSKSVCVCRDHVSDVLLIRSCTSLLKSHEIFLLWVFRPTQNDIFFSSFIFSWKLKLLWRLDKGNGQARKACNCLTWSKLNFRGCNVPFQARGMKSFWSLRCFKVREEPN